MRYFAFSVAAGARQALPVSAAFIYYESVSVGAAYPRIRITGGDIDEILRPGQGISVPKLQGPFEIYNHDGGGTITGLLIHAGTEAEFIDKRVVGSVTVDGEVDIGSMPSVTLVDSPAVQVLAAGTFAKWCEQSGGGASYASTQLWNPAASGKNLYLRRIMLGGVANKSVYVGTYDTALSSNAGVGVPFLRNGAASTSVGQGRREAAGAPRVTDYFFSWRCLANDVRVLEFPRPLIITPEHGVSVADTALNQLLDVSYEWDEVTP